MPRRSDPEKQRAATELRKQGLLLKDISERIGVPERTVRRWVRPVQLPPREGGVLEAPERQWPAAWTIDSLSDLPGFKLAAWEGNMGLIEIAERRGNEYVPWFFRRLVETGRHYQTAPAKATPWLYAIAGLPVLAEWLTVPECESLAQVIAKHEPWNGGLTHRSVLSTYRREAQSLARAIEAGIGRALLFPPQSADAVFPITLILRIFAQWLPQFDKTPLLARLQRMELGVLFLLIFRNPKPEYGGQQ